ncbi:MAG: iron hydrogenase small subunit [Deltaproteobacteria bacterium]|uniref:Iron hydrogenase small subunit n=1 Tax=Candidatus Zymogenus saltonus TaxID=2844893 RepID=A0A9D8KFF8_9DELT|nr:iron hydrogenase small subunit [Candidatus Zymogenus saltonus]
MLHLTINDISVEVPEGTTILEAAKGSGIHIPSLCYMKDLTPIGACRVCLVEVEGAKTLVASCITPARDGMKVYTKTARVRNARRNVVELLLSEHIGECQTCDRNYDCELQAVARELGVRDIAYPGEKGRQLIDKSTPALVRDTGKCIKCRRCVTVCGEVQGVSALFPQERGFDTVIGPAFALELDDIVCVQCGQCSAVCPVGAISEKNQIGEVWAALDDPDKHVVVQTAPAIRAALGECFDNPPGTLVTGKMVSALRRIGFDAVFDTNFAADLTIMEEGTELLTRLKTALVDKKKVALPMFTSCSPGWIKYIEHFYPDMLANVSTCKSPQQMFGAVAKTYYAEKLNKKPEDIFVVSIMPCTAKKYECQRPEMNDSGVRDVDVVLTTRELGRMIKEAGIDFNSLPDDKMDAPLGMSSGAADIFANTGGVMEAALRTAYEIVTGKSLPFENLHVKDIVGLEGVKEASVTISETVPEWSFLKGATLNVAVAHGLGNARKVIERVRAKEADYHFIEIMACPGGCIGGGGQPRMTTKETRLARINAIYREDEGKKLRKSHENPEIKQIYDEFLKEPLGKKSHKLLHTKYTPRTRV